MYSYILKRLSVKKSCITILQHLSMARIYSSRQDLGGGDMDWMRGRMLLKPEDQLQLTEAVRLTYCLSLLNIIK